MVIRPATRKRADSETDNGDNSLRKRSRVYLSPTPSNECVVGFLTGGESTAGTSATTSSRHSECADEGSTLSSYNGSEASAVAEGFSDGDCGDDSSQCGGGFSGEVWLRLKRAVVGKPLSMRVFQREFKSGDIYKYYRRNELNKLMAALRDILEEHGELRLAATVDNKSRMKDLAAQGASALNCFFASRKDAGGGATQVKDAHSATTPPPPPPTVTPLKHNEPSGAKASTSFPPSTSNNNAAPVRHRLKYQLPRGVGNAAVEILSLPLDDNLPVEAINEVSSPFHRVLHVVMKTQLCFGSANHSFEVPQQYLEGVASRRLRLHVVPFRPPFIPMSWPVIKEIAVTVNGQAVMTMWRRRWPERRKEVTKTLLPLDITQFLNRNCHTQELGFVVTSKEYVSQVALLVVQLVPQDEVMNSIVTPLCNPQNMRDASLYAMYRSVLEDEEMSKDEMVVDNPVITTKCPISQARISIPIRGAHCAHLQCFDCRSFLQGCHSGCYWNCPLCDSPLAPRDIRVDTVLLRCLQQAGEKCPAYLQLVRNDREAKAAVHTASTAETDEDYVPFRWVPKKSVSGVVDVVLDDDDESSNDVNKPLKPVVACGGSSDSFFGLAELGADSSDDGEAFVVYRRGRVGGNVGDYGSRASQDGDVGRGLRLGTADHPIVL
ncbi:putative zinc finger protein [Trypanosoma equiperdum]|uniref:SP-RING-type domain-containing protein n=2 Tax=Trypanozoon TaxID=39700 RepID=Q38DR7_TRYB2|nr:hypothetical protein, conserved [Trypanosoma brucei brucei TREU927]EAN77053.1 hypothetical protein, conserved [Trypanosoma brucei brucei TREU927]SCU68909.1 predicted zinc finger protein [Trypanosoma equiperdum]